MANHAIAAEFDEEIWFRLSWRDGGLKPTTPPSKSRSKKHWVERDLEALLALNPDFLNVADHFPLRLGGLTTATSPDQVYVDELGRLVVVEMKKIPAGLGVIAQTLAYADHWRMLPPGEVYEGLRHIAGAEHIAEEFGKSLNHLQAWSKGTIENKLDIHSLRHLGGRVVKRLSPMLAENNFTDIKSFAQKHWGNDRLPCTGVSARIVLVAPSFDHGCQQFADHLSERMVAIELLEVDIVQSRGRIYVRRYCIFRNSEAEPTWRGLRRAWRHRLIRDNFAVNGWADHRYRESFSLSALKAPDARLWFEASDHEGSVWTVVPNLWCKGELAKRNLLRKRFLDALPARADLWKFRLPKEQALMDRRVLEVAKAVHDVLVPANPTK